MYNQNLQNTTGIQTRENEMIEIYTEFKKEEDIELKEFLGDFYDDLILLTNDDKQKILDILEHYADKSGFFERIREHIEHLKTKQGD
jgi:hypothetical protein